MLGVKRVVWSFVELYAWAGRLGGFVRGHALSGNRNRTLTLFGVLSIRIGKAMP